MFPHVIMHITTQISPRYICKFDLPYKKYYLYMQMFVYAKAVNVNMEWMASTYSCRSKFFLNVCLIDVTCLNNSSCLV